MRGIIPQLAEGLKRQLWDIVGGTRVPVKTLFEYLEDNYSLEEFLECFPSVTRETESTLRQALKTI